MANGSKESISRLKDIMSGKDSIHLWRVYKDDVNFDLSEDGKTLSANGDCAWSVSSSFNKRDIPEGSNALTIREISEKLGLTIEIWADEEGFDFSEHYLCSKGKVLVDKECDDGVPEDEKYYVLEHKVFA